MPLRIHKLIQSIRKVTPVAAFLYQGLLLVSYPVSLVWEDHVNLACRLKCIHKKKKDHSPETEQMFQDYITFKPRKSIANKQGERSVLLQAIKNSPYLEIDEILSTADEKFIRFTEKFILLLNSLLQENTPEASFLPAIPLELENSLISTNDVNMAETSDTTETVPDVDMEDSSEELPSSLYPENGSSSDLSRQEGMLANGSLVFAQPIPAPEQPKTLPLNEESSQLYPAGYDPLDDFRPLARESCVAPSSASDISVNSPNKASAFEMHDICSVKLEGRRVHFLPDAGPSTSGSSPYRMFTIRPILFQTRQS